MGISFYNGPEQRDDNQTLEMLAARIGKIIFSLTKLVFFLRSLLGVNARHAPRMDPTLSQKFG